MSIKLQVLPLIGSVLFSGSVFANNSDSNSQKEYQLKYNDKGCSEINVTFSLEASFEPDGAATLLGPTKGSGFDGGNLYLYTKADHIKRKVDGLAPDSTISALAIGRYTFPSGDQLNIEVINISDLAQRVAVGIQTIKGGTGEFENATGVFRGTGLLRPTGRDSEVFGTVCLG